MLRRSDDLPGVRISNASFPNVGVTAILPVDVFQEGETQAATRR